MSNSSLDELCINTIRMLSADGVEKAKSGHPGLPMGAATFAYTLWSNHLRFNPRNPAWANRDRFILSAGHGSMLLYSLLHLTGYDLPMSELRSFRQLGSKCPGHPEFGRTPGVETTTGPLGQGFANGVGMALAERFLADRYNREATPLIDYYIYALVSDGDLEEGVSAEAAALAGGLKLGKLVYLYDSNHISIEGRTNIAFRENTRKRFDAYGWHTLHVNDGNDVGEVNAAIEAAKKDPRPSLIIINTHIGFGSPGKHDSAAVHGAPLGEEELKKTKENLGWPLEPAFYVPDAVREHMGSAVQEGERLEREWGETYALYKERHPKLMEEFEKLADGSLPEGWDANLPDFADIAEPVATRVASGKVMNAIAPSLPFFVGGSADLAPSNETHLNAFGDVTPNNWDVNERNLHFGIREHSMAAVVNGIALNKQFQPFASTFFIFSDYMRGAMRLSALMGLRVVYVLTHDSVAQGEDGATHQPIEHLASFRAMPNMTVIRPADAPETAEAWRYALQHADGPTLLVLSRQKVPLIDRTVCAKADGLHKGAYVLRDAGRTPDAIIIATGSEVSLALQAADTLAEQGKAIRVVSMPNMGLYEQQSDEYKQSVLPREVKARVSLEAAATFGWGRYVGEAGRAIGIDHFGDSAPGDVLMEHYGFTAENVAKTVLETINGLRS